MVPNKSNLVNLSEFLPGISPEVIASDAFPKVGPSFGSVDGAISQTLEHDNLRSRASPV